MSDDFVIAGVDGEELRGRDGWIDITGADDLEIMIKDDGRVLGSTDGRTRSASAAFEGKC
jgi:hypothetical protein